MPVRWTKRFTRDWKKLPITVRKKAQRVTLLLDSNREHPSLRLKRLKRLVGYWELRVDDDWRIIMMIEGDLYTFMAIGRHDMLDSFRGN